MNLKLSSINLKEKLMDKLRGSNCTSITKHELGDSTSGLNHNHLMKNLSYQYINSERRNFARTDINYSYGKRILEIQKPR